MNRRRQNLNIAAELRRRGQNPSEFTGSADLARQAGVTLRQLQWWDEQGLITPLHIGHNRLYDPVQVQLVHDVGKLRRVGIYLKRAARISKLRHDKVDWIVSAIRELRACGLKVAVK